jgi:hypothetical protein
MMVDDDYVKKLLEAFESAPEPIVDILWLKENAGLDYAGKQFVFHMEHLHDEGFIERDDRRPGIGLVRAADGSPHWSVLPLRLTARGRDFLRGGQKPAGDSGYNIHVSGNNARVSIHSIDQSTNTINNQQYDLITLAAELAKLRTALLERAQDPEHYAAIGTIATAEIEAKSGDASKVSQTVSALGAAGHWVFDTANEIGVQVLAEILKKQFS